jgi:hypothetical protein
MGENVTVRLKKGTEGYMGDRDARLKAAWRDRQNDSMSAQVLFRRKLWRGPPADTGAHSWMWVEKSKEGPWV